MRAPWNRNEHAEVERTLRASRPEPSRELLDAVMTRVQPDAAPSRRRTPRLALASVVAATGLTVMAAFGGVGYAHSQAKAAGHAFKSAWSQSSNRGDSRHHNNHASHHAYPNPGWYCVERGSKKRIKLILTQRRFDRLTARGWSIGEGPFSSFRSAKAGCFDHGADDGD